MLELLDNDPEMRARYDRLVNGDLGKQPQRKTDVQPPTTPSK